jgi:hypothetical protein
VDPVEFTVILNIKESFFKTSGKVICGRILPRKDQFPFLSMYHR